MFRHTENRNKTRFRRNASFGNVIGGLFIVAMAVAFCFRVWGSGNSRTEQKTPPPPPEPARQAESAQDHTEELAPKPVVRDLGQVPTNEWTDAEKEANQRLFLEKYHGELAAAVDEMKRQIDHHTREKIKNEKLEQIERRKVANAEEFIRKAKAAVKTKKFPVVIDGQSLSQQELEMLFLRYSRLVKDRRPVADEYKMLKNVAEQQLHKLDVQLSEKLAMLDKSGIYLKRLEASEHIGRINEVIAKIEDSAISAQVISDSFKNTFAREEKKVETIKAQEKEELKSLYE